jgi:hypothetical protein
MIPAEADIATGQKPVAARPGLTGAAFVNPSIQTVGYTMGMLGALLHLPLRDGTSARH